MFSHLVLLLALGQTPTGANAPALVRTARDGRWSDPSTWQGARVPQPGDRVQIRGGHRVTFDARIDRPIRSIHVAGTLAFDPDQDTRLTVGLIKIQRGDDPSETGFEADSDAEPGPDPGSGAVLQVGSRSRPVAAGKTAVIRLAAVEGLDPESTPALVCSGGTIELQGARVEPTWLKLGATAAPGEQSVKLSAAVKGWKVGDRLIVTATRSVFESYNKIARIKDHAETEVRTITAIEEDGTRLRLDRPLKYEHLAEGAFRGEVGLLTRNVVIESANPDGARGHTLFHRHSHADIAFAEFRHLGKAGKLGKYNLHFHRAGETMRGSIVEGASFWESQNRWVTIHGTNRLVLRDCVAFGSVGHGFFLEDGTEVNNILDHNLAVQATVGKPLPGQLLAYDRNEGAGFWWANSRNAFTRNVAVECDEYGFRYEAPASTDFDPVLNVRDDDGRLLPTDIRTQPFLRFEANEGHSLPRFGFNMGGAPGEGETPTVGPVGPDPRHPFVIKDLKLWGTHWAFSPVAPSLLVDGLQVHASNYGLWRPMFKDQAYRGVEITRCRWFFMKETGSMSDEASYPKPLKPQDDRPPVTVVTSAEVLGSGRVRVRGVVVDDTEPRTLRLNGQAHALTDIKRPVVDWEVTLDSLKPGPFVLEAASEDAAGNVEKRSHRLEIRVR